LTLYYVTVSHIESTESTDINQNLIQWHIVFCHTFSLQSVFQVQNFPLLLSILVQ